MLAECYRFFHWHLEFPEVFANDSAGGFDVVLGNPPWERIKLQEKEFFATRDQDIATASTAATRRRLIRQLLQTNPDLHATYSAALRDSEATSHFLRASGHFPLTSGGDTNTYAVFAGLARQLLAPAGRAGLVIPLGIATDYTYRDFFADVMEKGAMVSFYDFENREGIFPGVHRNYNFALTTLIGAGLPQREAEFAFFMTQFDHLQDEERLFTLGSKDLSLINPNTQTCPIFNTRRDTELTLRIYHVCSVLHNEKTGENPWEVSFLRMFDMTNDSGLFRSYEQMEAEGFVLVTNRFIRGDENYLPLYEAKMMHQFDHRHGTFEGQSPVDIKQGYCREPSLSECADANFVVRSRYWVSEAEVKRVVGETNRHWFISFRDVTRAVDRRTSTFTLLPWSGVGNQLPIMLFGFPKVHVLAGFLANVNSLTFDFVARQKVGGIHMNFFIVKQLPVRSPHHYSSEHLQLIVPRILELTYTAWDIKAFADDVWREAAPTPDSGRGESLREAIVHQWEANVAATGGHVGAQPPTWVETAPDGFPHPPFKWDEERRAHLRAELDALYGHLYGLTRDELDYILDTFPILRRKDEARYGEYRTKRLVLEYYEELEPLRH